MAQPALKFHTCSGFAGTYKMAYWEWGDPNNQNVLICLHGLTGQGRDFDYLAKSLRKDYRIICPDIVGRGRSDWLVDGSQYQIPIYSMDIIGLMDHLGIDSAVFLGSSMGGFISLGVAAIDQKRIKKLILNDVSLKMEFEGYERIADYVGRVVQFNNLEEAVLYTQEIAATFGHHSFEQWAALTEPGLKEHGRFLVPRYDIRIADNIRSANTESKIADSELLWQIYDGLTMPTLLIRGERSDFLSYSTAIAMTQRGPKAKLIQVPNVGHSPTFMFDDQVQIVKDFL